MESPVTVLRPGWMDVPAAVRAVVAEKIGARVLGWTSLSGGLFESGYELQLQAGGVNYYVKMADSLNPAGFAMLRTEIAHTLALPSGAPVPPPVWTIDQEIGQYGRWLAIGFVMQPVRLPRLPWVEADVDEALELAYAIGDVVAPDPRADEAPYAAWQDVLDPDAWARVAKDRPGDLAAFGGWLPARADSLVALAGEAASELRGDRLAHHLLRAENVLLAAERGAIPPLTISWTTCSVGPACATALSMLGFMQAQGGPAPEAALAVRPLPASYDADELTAYLAILAGHHIHGSLLPPDPALPLSRSAQREHAKVLTDWLRRRLGW